ncbi:MAG: dephospho-CoA kinase [Planctomycetota bacterium]
MGGVGSGKSAVAALLAKQGLLVLDADAEARAVVELPAVRAALQQRFGADIVGPDGLLDRPLLARRAFQDQASTADLNALVHPEVRRRLLAALAAAGTRSVVLDVPLLLESAADSALAQAVTSWVFVESPEAQREARVAGRGWAAGERVRREARQASLADKRRRATHTLENSGSIEDLGRQVEALLKQLGLP